MSKEITENSVESVLKGIQISIKEQLVTRNNEVRESYINEEVSTKLQSRITLVKKALAELVASQKELLKIKPDQISYDVSGTPVQEFYSKEVIEKRNKTIELQTKIENALVKAFETADYSDLEKLIK